MSSRDVCNVMTMMIDANNLQKPIVGDNAGFVRMLDQSNFMKDGTAYTGKFQTASVPLIEGGMRRANLVSVEITYEPTGAYTLYMDVYLDGEFAYTIPFSMLGGVIGDKLDSFILGTSMLGAASVPLIEGGMRRANLVSVEITYEPTGAYTLYMDVYLDGEFAYTIPFSMLGGVTGDKLDSFILGTSMLGGGGGTYNSTKRLMGDCRRISFLGYNSDLNGNFSISNIRVYFTPGSRRF